MRLQAYTRLGGAPSGASRSAIESQPRHRERLTEALRPQKAELKLAERQLVAKMAECRALRNLCETSPAGRYDEFVDALAPILGPAQHRALKAMLGGGKSFVEHVHRLDAAPAIRIGFRESGAGTDDPKDPNRGDVDDLCARLGIVPGSVLAQTLARSLSPNDNQDDSNDDTEESISGSAMPMQESSGARIAIAFDRE